MVTIRSGSRFGRLVVLSEGEPYIWRGRVAHRQWLCACDCGGRALVRDDRLKAGTTRSCGCLHDELARDRLYRHGAKSGGRATPEYLVWQALLHQGELPVERRWRAKGTGFAAFLEDLGKRPGRKYRLVRLDPRRGYAAGNCAWAFAPPRLGVPRRSIRFRGRAMSLREAAEASGIAYPCLCKRLQRGWPARRALQP